MLNYISCKLLIKLYPFMAQLSPHAHQQGITHKLVPLSLLGDIPFIGMAFLPVVSHHANSL